VRLGSVLAFAAGFVGAAVVVGVAARARLTPQGEAVQRRLAAEGAALTAEAEAYANREQARIRTYAQAKIRATATTAALDYTAQLGIPQIQADVRRLQARLASIPNPFALIG
jgi:outer membrane murein-binding lipoprotein Lpp